MVFSSLIFVFLFFTANIITQAVVTDMRKKNIVMLAFSLVFYAWGGIQYVPLLMGMTFICWYSALLIARRRSQHDRKLALITCVVLVLLILGIFKYTGFFLRNVQLLLGFPKVIPEIMLPIGISFYTFQLLSYVIDVYRGDAEVQEKYWRQPVPSVRCRAHRPLSGREPGHSSPPGQDDRAQPGHYPLHRGSCQEGRAGQRLRRCC